MSAPVRNRKLYELRRARGVPVTVPIERVRARIAELNQLGLTNLMIGYAAGLGKSTVGHIMNRSTLHTHIDVAAAIYQVTHHPHPRQPTVLTIGAKRRIRSLNAIGWPTGELGQRLGQPNRSTLNLALADNYTTYNMWSRIRDLYEELSGTPGPSKQSIAVARRGGHVPPLAWEGIDIDDPRAQPDWAATGIKLADRPVCINGHLWSKDPPRDNRGNRMCRECRRNHEQTRREKRRNGALLRV